MHFFENHFYLDFELLLPTTNPKGLTVEKQKFNHSALNKDLSLKDVKGYMGHKVVDFLY